MNKTAVNPTILDAVWCPVCHRDLPEHTLAIDTACVRGPACN